MRGLRALQRYARPRAEAAADGAEKCELCHERVGAEHPHLVDLDNRGLACACRACALLFTNPAAARGRYRTVPDRVLADPDSALSEAEWGTLEVPVRLAFFFMNSRAGRWVAFFPGPAGATECELPLEAWTDVVAHNRLVAAAQPDVEAVLAWGGPRSGPIDLFVVPISAPYALVAKVRQAWRGFDGGDGVRDEVSRFFAALREQSALLRPGAAGGAS